MYTQSLKEAKLLRGLFQMSRKKMTKAEALKEFRQIYNSFCGGEPPRYRRGDVIAKRTHWNDYTDGLCKDGLITLKQYENWGQPF